MRPSPRLLFTRTGSRVRVGIGIGALAAACNGTPTGTIDLITGAETDVFSRAPAPTTLVVESLALGGDPREIARVALPATTVPLGDAQRTDVGALRVTGLGANNQAIVRGESLFLQFGALQDQPLEVFVQRTRELARLPRVTEVAAAPLLDLAVGRYVLAVSADRGFLYDLLRLGPATDTVVFPRSPKSVITYASTAIGIDDAGAFGVDLASGASTILAAPANGSWADVAGGAAVIADDGTGFVVGATRAGTPSATVLRIDAGGTLSFATLTTARVNACATWVAGRGLVVVGGGPPSASGVELLATGATQATALAFAPEVTACAATALDSGKVLAIGAESSGTLRPHVFDLACTANCAGEVWPAMLPLSSPTIVGLGSAAIVAAEDANGVTHVHRVAADGTLEVPSRAPHRRGRLIRIPYTHGALLVGGGADFEQYLD